jgi:AcrR family transcriptional regulator
MSNKTTEREDVPPLADTSAFRAPPVTARGARTRASLVAAARVVFERDGYLDARLTDITAEAKCSTGSFYTYFSSKDEIFQAVMEAAQHDMLHPGFPRIEEAEASPEAVIRASNRAYLEAYKRNAKLMQILEQVAVVDPKFREVRRSRSRVFLQRNARGIKRLQDEGLVDPELDPMMAARALSGMVARLAYDVFCLGEKVPMKQMVDTTTRMWVNALKLKEQG